MASSTYWLNFRIHEKGNPDKRRDDLYEGIGNLATKWWLESTSFILFESKEPLSNVVSSVKLAIDTSMDLVVIGRPAFLSFTVVGKCDDFNPVLEMVPFAKRV